MKLVRPNAILPFPNFGAADFSDKSGFPVLIDPGTNTAQLCTSALGFPAGVIVDGRPANEQSSIGIAGGLAGTVRVKILQDVLSAGKALQLVQVGADIAFGPDAETGDRRIVGRSLEPGAAGELIEAVIWPTQVYS